MEVLELNGCRSHIIPHCPVGEGGHAVAGDAVRGETVHGTIPHGAIITADFVFVAGGESRWQGEVDAEACGVGLFVALQAADEPVAPGLDAVGGVGMVQFHLVYVETGEIPQRGCGGDDHITVFIEGVRGIGCHAAEHLSGLVGAHVTRTHAVAVPISGARQAVQVGDRAAGVGAGFYRRGAEAQAQVVVGGAGGVVGAFSIHEERLGVYVIAAICAAGGVPTAGAAAALDVAVSDDGGAAVVIVDFWSVSRGAIAPHNDVRQRWAAYVVVHPAAGVIGGVAAKGHVGQRRVAILVEHPPAVVGGGVAAECHVGQRRVAGVVVHPAAVTGRVAAEGDVGQRQFAGVVVLHPAAVTGRVAAEGDVHQRRAAVGFVVHPAAGVNGEVFAEGDVGQRRAAEVVVHPAAVFGRVAAEGDVGQRWATGGAVHPAAPCVVA